MTIRQKYEEVKKRMKSNENKEKYQHLYAEVRNSKNEMMLLVYLAKLEECIRILEQDIDLDKMNKDLWENTCKVWIKRIEICLAEDNWK